MKLSKACRVICNIEKKKVIVANLDNGTWILIPLSCWEIVRKMDEQNVDPEVIYANAYDNEDESYLRYILGKLLDYDFLVPEEKLSDTYKCEIRKVAINLTYRCNLRCRHCCVDAKHVSEFTEKDELNANFPCFSYSNQKQEPKRPFFCRGSCNFIIISILKMQ